MEKEVLSEILFNQAIMLDCIQVVLRSVDDGKHKGGCLDELVSGRISRTQDLSGKLLASR